MKYTVEERMEDLMDELTWEINYRLSNIYDLYEIDTYEIMDAIADDHMDGWMKDFGFDDEMIWNTGLDIADRLVAEKMEDLRVA